MKKNARRGATLLLAACLTVLGLLAFGIVSTLAEGTDSAAIKNRDDTYAIDIPVENEQVDADHVIFGLHRRKEAYDPASALISGILFAPEGTEILQAQVTVSGHGEHTIVGTDILRFQSSWKPASLDGVKFQPDEERAAFAFLTDLREEVQDGTIEVSVRLSLSNGQELSGNTEVHILQAQGSYGDVTRAIRGWILTSGDQGKPVENLQGMLLELGYLREHELSGILDEKTMNAVNKLLGERNMQQQGDYLSPEAVGFIEAGAPESETAEGTETEASAGSTEGPFAFLKNHVALFGREIPVWMLTATGAALLLLVVLIILLVTGKKRRSRKEQSDYSAVYSESTDVGFISEAASDESQSGDMDDEPTVDLSGADSAALITEARQEIESDSAYVLKIRMIYNQMYLDSEVTIHEGGTAMIGRGQDADIQTNPEDFSVSHKQGVFTVGGKGLTYTDASRNGTLSNGQRILRTGESVHIPLNVRIQLDMGAHKILAFAVKKP